MEEARIADYIDFLEQENQKLKKQLSKIKYLDSKEVKKLIYYIANIPTDEKLYLLGGWDVNELQKFIKNKKEVADEVINKICSLALPSKKKIIEILNKYFDIDTDFEGAEFLANKECMVSNKKKLTYKKINEFYNKIASEILGDDKNEINKIVGKKVTIKVAIEDD